MRHVIRLAATLTLATALIPGPAGAAESGAASDTIAYDLVDLGGLGGTASFALGINERGDTVGTARTGGASRPQIAAVWDRQGRTEELGTFPGSTFSRAFAINPHGDAVGEAFTAPPESSRAVLWDRRGLTDLGSGVANDINARGQVAGVSGGQAVVWQGGEPTAVGTLSTSPAVTSRATALNDRGQVVGSSQTDVLSGSGARVSHAFLATPRGNAYVLTDLGSVGGAGGFSVATDVNARGAVVGESVTEAGGSTYVGFRWSQGRLVALPPIAGRTHSVATAINDRGVVVGHVSGFRGFATIDGLAVVWDGVAATDLNTLIAPDSGWVLRTAEGINASGQIVGFGTFAGETRAFRLDPRR